MKLLALAAVLVGACAALAQAGPKRADAIYDAYESDLVRRLDMHFHDGEFIECLSVMHILRGIRPDDAFLVSQIAWMLGNLTPPRHAEALTELIKFRRSHPANPEAAFHEAEVFFSRKVYERVPPLLEPVIERSEGIGSLVMLAWSYERLGLLKESLRIWEMRLSRNPADAVAKANIARLKQEIGSK